MILHITTKSDWEEAREKGVYVADSLKTEGFIHCSRPEQVIRVANYLFKGQIDLVLLCINEDRVLSEIRYEGKEQIGEDFPHIYGPLNLDAVVDVLDFKPDSNGLFKLPEKLTG